MSLLWALRRGEGGVAIQVGLVLRKLLGFAEVASGPAGVKCQAVPDCERNQCSSRPTPYVTLLERSATHSCFS